MDVGIPRALLYYRYGKFWEKFLAGLGANVVVTRKTDKVLVEKGLGHVSSEVCLPIKILAGHLADLKGRVDAVFLPRIVWLEDHLYACPKMIGIVDIARMMLGNNTKLIAPSLKGNILLPHLIAGLKISPNPIRVIKAFSHARSELSYHTGEPEFRPGEKRVALISHFYNLGDDYVAHPILSTFSNHGYRICTKDELPESILRNRDGFAENIRWVYERELYNAFVYFMDKVDGVCVVMSMGCGPDSLVAEFMRQQAHQHSIPFLQLVIDEHTGEAGLVTRIEAFIDMAERRKSALSAA